MKYGNVVSVSIPLLVSLGMLNCDDNHTKYAEVSATHFVENTSSEMTLSPLKSGNEEVQLVAGLEVEASKNMSSANVTKEAKEVARFGKRISCSPRPVTNNEVVLMNGSYFLHFLQEQNNANVTNRTQEGDCSLGFFYASWCPFSARAAPHFNGLARLYPNINMLAVDTGKYHGINTQFGILALPTLILFHNSKPLARYNLTEYLVEPFAAFLTLYTEQAPAGPITLEVKDFAGPVPTKEIPEPDYYLYLAWIFTVLCAIIYFAKSSFCQRIFESIRNTWREAEIQHEHHD